MWCIKNTSWIGWPNIFLAFCATLPFSDLQKCSEWSHCVTFKHEMSINSQVGHYEWYARWLFYALMHFSVPFMSSLRLEHWQWGRRYRGYMVIWRDQFNANLSMLKTSYHFFFKNMLTFMLTLLLVIMGEGGVKRRWKLLNWLFNLCKFSAVQTSLFLKTLHTISQ